MTEAKHRFTTFEEGYQQLREKWHDFEVGSPEFQALCDFNDRSNFDQRRESALQVHANAKKDNLQLDIQVILETNLDYYTLRLTQTQERIEQRLSTITGYALALKEISSEAHGLSSLHPKYDGENIHDEVLHLLAEVKSNILYIPVEQQNWRTDK